MLTWFFIYDRQVFRSPKSKIFISKTHSYFLEAEPKMGYTAVDTVESEEHLRTRILWNNGDMFRSWLEVGERTEYSD